MTTLADIQQRAGGMSFSEAIEYLGRKAMAEITTREQLAEAAKTIAALSGELERVQRWNAALVEAALIAADTLEVMDQVLKVNDIKVRVHRDALVRLENVIRRAEAA